MINHPENPPISGNETCKLSSLNGLLALGESHITILKQGGLRNFETNVDSERLVVAIRRFWQIYPVRSLLEPFASYVVGAVEVAFLGIVMVLKPISWAITPIALSYN